MKLNESIIKNLNESYDDELFLEVSYEDGTVIIGTESSSGAEFECHSNEDLKKAFCDYVDAYVDLGSDDSEE